MARFLLCINVCLYRISIDELAAFATRKCWDCNWRHASEYALHVCCCAPKVAVWVFTLLFYDFVVCSCVCTSRIVEMPPLGAYGLEAGFSHHSA